MNLHRLLLLIAAICLVVFGALQITQAFTTHRNRERRAIEGFYGKYRPSNEDSARYSKLFHDAIALRTDLGSITVLYYTTVGGSGVVISLLILAALAETRPRGQKKKPSDDEDPQ